METWRWIETNPRGEARPEGPRPDGVHQDDGAAGDGIVSDEVEGGVPGEGAAGDGPGGEGTSVETAPCDGATHMAVDTAFLRSAVAMRRPVFRVYTWDPYCISIGYHQKKECINLDRCLKAGIDVVRRPTGGRAVFHAEEVTYSVIIPATSASFDRSTGAVYANISRGLAEGLKSLGVDAELEKRSVDLKSHYETSDSVSCFSAAARYEIVVGSRKLVGSAQKRDPSGVLQHGSILTGPAHLDLPNYLAGPDSAERKRLKEMMKEKTTNLTEWLEREVSWEEVTSAIRKGLEAALHIEFEDSELTDEELWQAEMLRSDYSIISLGEILGD